MPNEAQVRVLVVDDHVGIRVGIASLIDAERPGMRCVGTAATASEALVQTRELQPDVVVLDVNLAGEDGLILIPTLRRSACCAVVVLTSLSDTLVAAHALRLGAYACLNKTAPAIELVTAILAACMALPRQASEIPAIAGGALSHATGMNRP
jgi:two-component system, NarL family, nitrate/nitrite response regulator NarL